MQLLDEYLSLLQKQFNSDVKSVDFVKALENARTTINGFVSDRTANKIPELIAPNVIKQLKTGLAEFIDRHADRGWTSIEAFRGLLRDRVVTHSQIRRPDAEEYHGGHETAEGYAIAGEKR